YDNYDAINVDATADIPRDYAGAMGVPITFLDKYNPEQFDIIKFRKGNDEKDLVYTVEGKQKYPYFRIIIKNKGV
ncbi:MAG: adenine-specific methyltransferase EcoRI family protein, partial [Prevotellaceae bacterium]|nr:adenine-specific methyltransferase EcoRI family protein [Prevotellaceae bacterium]